MVEPLRDAVHHRRLQRVVMQDGRIDEGREFGLLARDLLGFTTDAHPHRIDLVEDACGLRLLLGHDPLLPPGFGGACSTAFTPESYMAANPNGSKRCCASLQGRSERKPRTPCLKARSRTDSMWSRPGMSSGWPRDSSAASSAAEPATSSFVP